MCVFMRIQTNHCFFPFILLGSDYLSFSSPNYLESLSNLEDYKRVFPPAERDTEKSSVFCFLESSLRRQVHNLMKGPTAVGYFRAHLKTFWCVYCFTIPLYFRKDLRWFTKMQTMG